MDEIIKELYDRSLDLSIQFSNTYWFMFKKRWELAAQAKQIKAIIILATEIYNEKKNNNVGQ